MKKICAILAILIAGPALADPAVIEKIVATESARGWTFSVTLRHGDTGWDDYADGWRVVAPDGTVLGTRVLAHPHETEQPFTRSQGGIVIPDTLSSVMVQARTLTEGWDPAGVVFDLPG